MIGRSDVEATRAVQVLRQAGRRVSRAPFGHFWTVGLAAYDRRQLLRAADRVLREAGALAVAAEGLPGERRP